MTESDEEVRRRECAVAGHGPDITVMADGEALYAYCQCGEVRWVREEKAA